ncbi:MAG: hypothetical protein IPM35_02580 [Myxococcales bacterium]|nr:hypothetical protein [Myxococcales bacterium]
MVKEQQTARIGIRFTPTEAKMVGKLSELTGLSMTDVIRQAIRREYSERVGELPATKKRKR